MKEISSYFHPVNIYNELRTVEKNSNFSNVSSWLKCLFYLASCGIVIATAETSNQPKDYYDVVLIPIGLSMIYMLSIGCLTPCFTTPYSAEKGEITVHLHTSKIVIKARSAEERQKLLEDQPSTNTLNKSNSKIIYPDGLWGQEHTAYNSCIWKTRAISGVMCVAYATGTALAVYIFLSHQAQLHHSTKGIEITWLALYAASAVMHGLRVCNPTPFGRYTY